MNLLNSDEFMGAIIENMETMFRIVDVDNNTIYMNKKMKEVFGNLVDCPCMTIMDRTEPCENCVRCQALLSGLSEEKTEKLNDRVYKVIATPAHLDKEDKYFIEIFQDITKQHEVEGKLLEHYDRLRESVEYAKRVQCRMLPAQGDFNNMVNLQYAYCPSEELGGDIFDIIKLSEDSCLFYVADVSGHGVKVALMTMFIRQTLRALEGNDESLHNILRYIEEQLQATNPDKEEYITILIGKYNKFKKELQLINAGHNCPAMLKKKDGSLSEVYLAGLPVSSWFSNIAHKLISIDVKKDEKVIFYTDGLVEAQNAEKEELGVEGLKKIITDYEDNEEMSKAEWIYGEAKAFTGGNFADDITVLEINFK